MPMNHRMEEHLDMPVSELLPIIQDRIMNQSTYFGVTTLKSPTDHWVYQEILFDMQPDVILEIGNNAGGSALAFAHMLDALGKGKLIGLDTSHERVPEIVFKHPRITLIEGDACASFDKVNKLISDQDRVLVIEDSSHTYANTLDVLRTYSVFTRVGDYFIVEDSICHHGLVSGPKPGPYEAIETFIEETNDFVIDRDKESFFVTWNPKGYLKRVASQDENLSRANSHKISAGKRSASDSLAKWITLLVPPILVKIARKVLY